jgi:hypothetical protein
VLATLACGASGLETRRQAATKALDGLALARIALVAWDGERQLELARTEPLDAEAAVAAHQARVAKVAHVFGFAYTALSLAVMDPSVANLSAAIRLVAAARGVRHASVLSVDGAAFLKSSLHTRARLGLNGRMRRADAKQYVTVEEAAVVAKVAPATIWRWASLRRLARYRLLGRTVFALQEIRALARDRKPAAGIPGSADHAGGTDDPA